MIGDPLSEDETAAMMASVDIDGSGSIDFRELVGMLAAREAAKLAETEIIEAFRVLSELQAHASGAGNDDVIDTAVFIGREGVTQALHSLAVEGLEDDAALTEQVVTGMMQWMDESDASTIDGAGVVSLDMFKRKILQLAEGTDYGAGDIVENPVGGVDAAQAHMSFTTAEMTH